MPTRRSLLRSGLFATAALPFAGQNLLGQASAPAAPEIFKLAPLPYAADALEPHIDSQTMAIHHGKHHATYVAKLNEALAKLPTKPKGTLEELTKMLASLDSVPEDIRTAVRNHGGGHYNHTLFWESLSAKGGQPRGDLLKAIESAFKSKDDCIAKLQEMGGKVFGSGWVWLAYDARSNAVAITTTPNQDTPLAAGHTPLLGIDVWEHAYYLKYQNRRPDYLKAVVNVINWDVVAGRYEKALKA